MWEVVLAFVGSFCAALLFNVKKGRLFWTGLSGAIGWAVVILTQRMTGQAILAVFLGAVAVGVYSEAAARLLKSPATIYSIPGIFPLVPGISAYESIQYLVYDKLPAAGGKVVETLAAAAAIASGILLVTVLFRFISRIGKPQNAQQKTP